jgi:hypothetical protein
MHCAVISLSLGHMKESIKDEPDNQLSIVEDCMIVVGSQTWTRLRDDTSRNSQSAHHTMHHAQSYASSCAAISKRPRLQLPKHSKPPFTHHNSQIQKSKMKFVTLTSALALFATAASALDKPLNIQVDTAVECTRKTQVGE